VAELALGIDAGGTATRWCLVTRADGAEVARGSTAPFSGHVFNDAARARAEAGLAEIAAALPPGAAPVTIAAGITGLPDAAAEAAYFSDAMAQRFALRPTAVKVGGDLAIAYLGRFRPGEGILVYAGTGSIAYHIRADGGSERAGGHGFMVDDHGSAFWIAMEALRGILADEDRTPGAGWSSPLGVALAAEIGSADWPEVRAFLYGGDRGRTGMLAPAVARLAQTGEPSALGLMQRAGRELAGLAQALRGRLGRLPVALAGGASRLHPAIAEAFAAGLGDAFSHDDIDAVLTAARIAAGIAQA
jgi:N-acetylglucosamine kinase-like BadF-type ATPase